MKSMASHYHELLWKIVYQSHEESTNDISWVTINYDYILWSGVLSIVIVEQSTAVSKNETQCLAVSKKNS